MVTISAPFDPAHVAQLLPTDAAAELERFDEVSVQIAGRSFRLRRQFLLDIRRQNLQSTIHTLGKALLVLHSPHDATVEIASAREIFDAARHPKSFVSLDSADHLLTDPADSAYVARVVAGWLRGPSSAVAHDSADPTPHRGL
ncbi:MAG TPA: hypothetical protein VGR26_05685 [Acidimicrobiales bacterium]|nr:hypothetical protein [Acidimicrobiales bacterium]